MKTVTLRFATNEVSTAVYSALLKNNVGLKLCAEDITDDDAVSTFIDSISRFDLEGSRIKICGNLGALPGNDKMNTVLGNKFELPLNTIHLTRMSYGWHGTFPGVLNNVSIKELRID